jgi:opacity protein-like surface antigen
MLGIGTMAQAQFRQSIYLNGNIPTGNFGSSASAGPDLNSLVTPPSTLFPTSGVPLTTEQIGKDASIGFGLGYRVSYRFDVGVGEVAPFVNADFLWNTISGSWRDKYSDAYYTSPTYFNIPLMGGVTYIYDEMPWNDISLFGEFGIGTDLFWITSEGSKDNIKLSYKSTFAFAWMLGAGAFFGEHVSVGLHYYGLGTHNIDYTQGTLDDNVAAQAQVTANDAAGLGRQRRSVGSLLLRIGFHF